MNQVHTHFDVACRDLSAQRVLPTGRDGFQLDIEQQRSHAARRVQAHVKLHRPTWEYDAEVWDDDLLERSTPMEELVPTTGLKDARGARHTHGEVTAHERERQQAG